MNTHVKKRLVQIRYAAENMIGYGKAVVNDVNYLLDNDNPAITPREIKRKSPWIKKANNGKF